ncbi:MAG: ribosome biogenesis GTPase Der [Mariprofundales bacterium]
MSYNQGQPVFAIVGRPNVGKSTLFNRLLGKRKAIVGDRPGVTIDRVEGDWQLQDQNCMLIDTGGIGVDGRKGMQAAIEMQVQAALGLANIVLFIVDGKQGLTPADQQVADLLRRRNFPVILVVNKAEKNDVEAEFYALGMGEPFPVSAEHGRGISELCTHLAKAISTLKLSVIDDDDDTDIHASIAVLGRPNVGKSTLINAWLGEDRSVVSDIAGTTRDAIDSQLIWDNRGQESTKHIRLVDTAGIRRHARVHDDIEFVSRVKARQALQRADAAVLLLDGAETIVDQDLRLLSLARECGCALVIAVNKGDVIGKDDWQQYVERLHYRLRGGVDAPVFRVSAKRGDKVHKLLNAAIEAAVRNRFEVSTGQLNNWLEKTTRARAAPSDDGAVVRLKYCVQSSTRPPTIKFFCNRPKSVKTHYKRYLERVFRENFNLPGVPLRLRFIASDNPYLPASDKPNRNKPNGNKR